MDHKNPRKYSEKELLRYLTKGLGRYTGAPVAVAIVGAGMAGLVAAWLLKRVGLNVKVYEASPRVGGRVRTLREGFSSGLYAEAGAMRIPSGHRLTLHLCKYFELTVADFVANDPNAWVYVNRERFRRYEYMNKTANFGAPYSKNLTAEQILASALEPLAKLFKEPEQLLYDESLLQLDHISLGDYLHAFVDGEENRITREAIPREKKLTHADIDLFGFDFGASDLRASLLEALRDHYIIGGNKKYQILGGMDLLPRSFLGASPKKRSKVDLTDLVCFHARVKEIRRKQGRFEVVYENSFTHVNHVPVQADFVILAAPFSALTHVRLDEVLAADRLHAIRNLHYENATKIILEFSKRFWELKDQDIHGGRSFTDLPIRWVHYPSPKQNPKRSDRGLLLASYTWGDDSLRWASFRPDDRIRFALRDIADLHGLDQQDCEKLLVGGMSHSWAEDEYTFGAFAIFDPHQEAELFDSIWKPYKKIHFAGEHTSLKHAWIEGAVESGIRAAAEVFLEASHGED